MVGRCRWLSIGRSEPQVPDATTPEQRVEIAKCEIFIIPRFRVIRECRLDGVTIGYVRTTFGGQEFKRDLEDEWQFAGSAWSLDDPPHGLAILGLLDLLKESRGEG